jgi:inner membrane protein import complex subunit Tim44-like protein
VRIPLSRWLSALLILFLCVPALARVGGGESYSGGGSSHSGGSGGGGGGEAIGFLLELLFRLVFYYPAIGIPLVIAIVVGYFYFQRSTQAGQQFRDLQNWSADHSVKRRRPPSLENLRRNDPAFSETLFLDFVNSLYSKLLLGMGDDLGELGAYLDNGLRARMEAGVSGKVDAVIIGSVRLLSIREQDESEYVDIEVESNLSLRDETELYVVDELTLTRLSGVKTNPPKTVYALACPYCGNTGGIDKSGQCSFCQQVVNSGQWSWVVKDFRNLKSTPKPPVVLSQSGLEIGTDLPTERSPSLHSDLAKLQASDPTFDRDRFEEFAKQTFLALQQAWTELKWEKARALETDYLFNQHQYWINSYQKVGVRNVLEEVEVTDLQLSKISIDEYFEGITVRLFARMKDYTVSADTGKVLSGFPDQPRSFSEYWTFVRRSGVTSKDRDATRCPSCGAPLDKVTQVGVCEYCQSKITRGDFDWILSRIEQDEAYFI